MNTNPLEVSGLNEGTVATWIVGEPALIRTPNAAVFGGAKLTVERRPPGATASPVGEEITPDKPGRWLVRVSVGSISRVVEAVAFTRSTIALVPTGLGHHDAPRALVVLGSLLNAGKHDLMEDGSTLAATLIARVEAGRHGHPLAAHGNAGHPFAGMSLTAYGASYT